MCSSDASRGGFAASYINRLHTKLNENQTDSQNYIMQSNGGTTTFDQSKKAPIHMVNGNERIRISGRSGAVQTCRMRESKQGYWAKSSVREVSKKEVFKWAEGQGTNGAQPESFSEDEERLGIRIIVWNYD